MAVVLVLGVPTTAEAQHLCNKEDRRNCAEAEGETVSVGVGTTVPEVEGANGEGRSFKPGSPLRREVKMVPTCDGSDATSDVGLCTAALSSCPTPDDVQFWVYQRTVDIRVPGDDPPFLLVTDPLVICRSLEDTQVVDPALAVAALIDRDFQQVVVLKGVPEVSPRPDTLVNIPTIFTTSSPPSYDIPLTLLGQSVVITATARTWTWNFGDGQSRSTSVPGSKGRVEHVYRQADSRGAYVVIEWTGTFTVNGGPVQQVNGTATTTGDPVAVEVKQARTELVNAPS